MTLAGLAFRNLARNRGRTTLTIVGIAVAIVLFVLMRTVIASWEGAVEESANDRLATRHKVSLIMSLPKKYVDDIRNVPGVRSVAYMNWFGGKDPNAPKDFFATIAINADSLTEVYPEIVIEPAQLEAFKQDRRGAIIGDKLAARRGYKIGQKLVLKGSIYPGDWEFIIDGIYTSRSKAMDRAGFWFHWDYLNDSPRVKQKDQVGWIASGIDDPSRSAAISKQIDALFDSGDAQTVTVTEKAFQQSFIGMYSAVLTAIDVVSIAVLAIILLILGNTIAMTVRERTAEYGCLRAIGFQPRHVALSVAAEALFIGVLGGLLGVGLAIAMIGGALGPYIEENVTMFFTSFRVTGEVIAMAFGLAGLMALLAALVPAIRTARLDVVAALRTVE
jgi:putative ABC transport system permease protein